MNSKLSSPRRAEIPPIPPGTSLTTLENGLVIIVREDHSAPVVSAQAWCMSGSVHEGKWMGAGLSHVLEHMLFKGTSSRPGSRIDQEVQEAGGYMNAYTSFDRTVYHIDVPSTGARTAIDILCDIMQNASLPAEELEKEKQVIVREMDMNVDDPQRRASRRLFETVYTRSPFRYTVIGYPDVFHTVSADDILAYYREKYVPNNVFYVVAGDVQKGEVVEQIRRAYANSRSKPLAPLVIAEEPIQTGPREEIEEAPIELGYAHLAWHVPDVRDPDAPALEILAALLGNGRSSRLYRRVREEKGLVHSISAWTYSPGGQGLMGISATIDPGKFGPARDAILAEVEHLRSEPVSAGELAKTVKQFLSATLASRKTMQGQAQDLGGCWISTGDLNFSERFLEAARGTTPEAVLRAAQKYLDPARRTLYCLLPSGTSPKQFSEVARATDSRIEKVELPNGLRLLLKEDHRLPFVDMRAVFCGGVLHEAAEKNGITQLSGRMLLKGTERRSAEEIASTIEEVGGSIESYGGNNSFGVNLEVLGTDFATAMNVLSDVLLHPTFPSEALEREREVQLAGIRAQRDHLLQSAFKAMRQALFDGRGYGMDTSGTESAVALLTREDLVNLHTRLAVPNNCVLSIFGDIDRRALMEAVSGAFGQWQPGTRAVCPSHVPVRSVRRVSEERDKKQAVIVLGYPGLTLDDPRRYALDLLQEACSDLGSRLFLRIREELGLAYFVGAQNFPGICPGYFAFYAGTLPEKASLVEEELKKEAGLLRSDGLTREELDRAKAKVIGQRKIARQDLGHRAMTAALDELYGLGYDASDNEDAKYEVVTLDDIREAARVQFDPGAHVVSIAGQPAP